MLIRHMVSRVATSTLMITLTWTLAFGSPPYTNCRAYAPLSVESWNCIADSFEREYPTIKKSCTSRDPIAEINCFDVKYKEFANFACQGATQPPKRWSCVGEFKSFVFNRTKKQLDDKLAAEIAAEARSKQSPRSGNVDLPAWRNIPPPFIYVVEKQEARPSRRAKYLGLNQPPSIPYQQRPLLRLLSLIAAISDLPWPSAGMSCLQTVMSS